jgi:hypothetical protein
MAMGTNIGLTKMANAAQWRLYEDALNKAQAVLVNFHHTLSLSSYWGDGTTSSSDGMRTQIHITELAKAQRFIDSLATNSLVFTRKSSIPMHEMPFTLLTAFCTTRRI